MPDGLIPAASGAGRVPIVVLKFGSSLLRSPQGFATAAEEVVREADQGRRVVCVCSARHGATEELLKDAHALGGDPPAHLVSRLLATGEAASVALLALAVTARGLSVLALDAADLGIRTQGPLLDADPYQLDTERLVSLLAFRPALVVPGFVGRHDTGETSLLGRGGSDLTALFLAHRLGAMECRLVKDVDGLHPQDPNLVPGGHPLREASWETAQALAGRLIQPKALRFAQEWNQPFRVAAPGGTGTRIGHAREAAS